jgi:magnesium-transporting ATPase (P-type)
VKIQEPPVVPESSINKFSNFQSPPKTPSFNHDTPKFSKLQVQKKQSLENKNFLFKGSKLRNTEWVLGIVLYTGIDTKIQQNGTSVRNKISILEKKISWTIMVLFFI